MSTATDEIKVPVLGDEEAQKAIKNVLPTDGCHRGLLGILAEFADNPQAALEKTVAKLRFGADGYLLCNNVYSRSDLPQFLNDNGESYDLRKASKYLRNHPSVIRCLREITDQRPVRCIGDNIDALQGKEKTPILFQVVLPLKQIKIADLTSCVPGSMVIVDARRHPSGHRIPNDMHGVILYYVLEK